MGTASGAFTALFGIDFPKAIYEGNVLGLVATNQYFCFLACMHVAYVVEQTEQHRLYDEGGPHSSKVKSWWGLV